MRVSFSGNIYLNSNSYSVKNQKGEEIKPLTKDVDEDIEINTDKVAYVSHQPSTEVTDLHMLNGDTISVNPPFNINMYNIAQQLRQDQALRYDSEGKISIFDNSIDKLREALRARGIVNNSTPAATVQSTEEVKEEPAAIQEEQPSADITENNTEAPENKPSGLASTYTLNGIDYDVVKMNGFNSLDEFQRFILSKGMTNRGKGGNDWPGQCHNFSCEYGDIMLGTSKIDLNSDNAAAEAKRGRDRQFQNAFCKTLDTGLQLMRAELEAGRPCVVKIRKPGTTQNHYGLVCGIRKDADKENLQKTDFLYIDSYDGKIAQLNGQNYRELTDFKNGIHIWKGKDYNFSYGTRGEYAKKYMSADEVKNEYGLA